MNEADLIARAESAELRARTAEDILRRVFPDLENLRAENVLLRSAAERKATPGGPAMIREPADITKARLRDYVRRLERGLPQPEDGAELVTKALELIDDLERGHALALAGRYEG